MMNNLIEALAKSDDIDEVQDISEAAVCLNKLIAYCGKLMEKGNEEERLAAAKALLALTHEGYVKVATYEH